MSNNEILSIDDQTLVSIMNKRHRSAKSFKSPPQPKFCIKESLSDGSKDVFINVLSYSRIANQLSEFDPVPLYGGMQIRSFNSLKNSLQAQQQLASPQLPPTQLIFAVMASPEVLKKTGRNCPETPEQSNLVELMCEFVEAMNPGLALSKKPEILKDRDLTGELKDIWSAVQNFREKEKSGVSDIVVYTEFGPDSATPISPIQKCMEESIESIMNNEVNSNEMNAQEKAAEALSEKSIDSTALNNNIVESPNTTSLESENVAIEKLSLSDKKSKNNNSNINENESSEKIVKVQNQKNKESQHHFFPKFLTSSKVKDDTAKDKEKDKEKHDEQETKVKTKKTLNFFRRNKSSTGSPTHNNNSDSSNNANNNITAD
ncbi:E3 ubiquitin-protein ligase cblA [Chironomus tepperi]|uniref:E3 ubiquitin-protein ligase cblA n=1 Tax=Chironomus tepperi TaxID=113505 RepID=UPI00391F5EC9